ncbi:hypothetical protein [Streptomyces sp. B21-083]|uniref:hypothetical protein n=1 Tax=Streptomyces sp. B21-083 TaxID=3039410 RepID=UPI002FF1D386
MPTPPKTSRPLRLPSAQLESGGGTGPLTVHPKVFRDELAAAADWVADYLGQITQRPVARPIPPAHRQALAAGILRRWAKTWAPCWSSSTRRSPRTRPATAIPPAGVIAELLATAVNATCGMGEHALIVELGGELELPATRNGRFRGVVIPEGCAVSAGRRRCGGRRPVR